MQYERAFSYQLEDRQWPTKLGLATVVSLVPILSFAVVGYSVAIIRNVSAGAAQPLPHWDDFGRKFVDGLLIALAGLVYSIPMLIALGVPAGLLITSGALRGSAGSQDWGRILGGAGWVILACVLLFVAVYALLLSIIRPVILVIFSRDGTFASCFRLQEMFEIIRRNTRPFFITWLAVILAGIGVGLIVGLVNLVIGWVPCVGWTVGLVLGLGSTIYLLTIDAYLFGQFRRIASEGHAPPQAATGAKSQQNPGDLSS